MPKPYLEHDAEKKMLEKAAVDSLLKCKEYQSYSLVEFRDRPDAVLRSENNELLGIEIVHPFLPMEAKLLLGRESGELAQDLASFIKNLNTCIERKCQKVKKFNVDIPVSLLIRSTSRLFFSRDFYPEKHQISITDNDFKDILLLFPEVARLEMDSHLNFPSSTDIVKPIEYYSRSNGLTAVHFPSGSAQWVDLVRLQ